MPSMRTLVRSLLLLAALALAPALARAAEDGAKVYRESCTTCHTPQTRPLDAKRLTRAEWKDAIERMEGMGTEVPSGDKLTALLDWLEKTHGPGSPPPAQK